jgi:hypothetical protein
VLSTLAWPILDARLLALEKRLGELRHGDGWIKNSQRGGIDGEYG